MDNIIALNNQVNGLKFMSMRVSSRTRRAMRSELIIPASAVEMTYSDMCLVNGGGMSSTYYLSNAEVWKTVGSLYPNYQDLNGALAGGGTAVFALIVFSFKSLSFYASIGAIPVIGWIALGILAVAATTVATVLVGCLITGKGFKISFNWDPKWYNPLNGLG